MAKTLKQTPEAPKVRKSKATGAPRGRKKGPKKIYKCPREGCGATFKRNDRLLAHLHMHDGTQPYQCTFPGCGKAFAERHNLKIHMKIHSDERPYSCKYGCGKTFRSKGNIEDHERRHINDRYVPSLLPTSLLFS